MRVPRDSDGVKNAIQCNIIAHILGPSASQEVMTTPLSKEQVDRARALQCTVTFRYFPYKVAKDEPKDKSVMTHGWLQTRVDEKFRTEWLDASWFSLVPELYGVNVAVWEPTGEGQEVQLYKKIASMWGLYLFDKKIKHDEEGHLWVHLLYRSGSSWTARVEIQGSGGTDRLNHFDCLELGTDVGGAFDDAISAFREYGGGGGEGDGDISPPPSPMPGKRRGAAGSAEETALKPRTSTQKSQPEADRGPQAQPKRKRAAKSEGISKRRKGKGEIRGRWRGRQHAGGQLRL